MNLDLDKQYVPLVVEDKSKCVLCLHKNDAELDEKAQQQQVPRKRIEFETRATVGDWVDASKTAGAPGGARDAWCWWLPLGLGLPRVCPAARRL